jgi:uncharacterized protein YfbU (UPF0304 family)
MKKIKKKFDFKAFDSTIKEIRMEYSRICIKTEGQSTIYKKGALPFYSNTYTALQTF